MEFSYLYPSPLGILTLTSEGEALTGLWMEGQKHGPAGQSPQENSPPPPVLTQTAQWLDGYFAGKVQDFTLPLAPVGTPFQQRVWQILATIPYGGQMTYGEIAQKLAADTGRPQAPRAVGGAVGRNPIGIILPCHRVMGAGGKLTGYAGGIHRKQWLLEWEQSHAPSHP